MERADREELAAVHRESVRKFMQVYSDLVVARECYNTGLRLLGFLSSIAAYTSRALGLNGDERILRELVRKLYAEKGETLKRVSDVEGLVGLTLLSRNLGCRELKWAEKKLKEIVERRRHDVTPQLAEARILLGEKSAMLYEHTCAAACINPLDETAPPTSTEGLSEREREVVELCLRLKRALSTPSHP